MRVAQFVLFLSVILVVLCGWHFYLWTRLVRAPAWPPPYDRVGTVVIAMLLGSIPLAMIGSRVLPRWAAQPLATVVFTWFGLAFLLLVSLWATELVTLAVRVVAAAKSTPTDPASLRLLARICALAATVTSSTLTSIAIHSAFKPVPVVEVPVQLSRLPSALRGMTLVQLSDVHIGPSLGRGFLERVVESVNAQHPDLVVITGDLVDGSVSELREHVEPLKRLKTRFGVYFVTGNHEYYSGVAEWLLYLEHLGIRVLRNEHVSIGSAEASFDLAGIDDASARGLGPGHGPDYAKALSGLDPKRELIVLAHQPKQVLSAVSFANVGLQISGHTHGGQIWPFRYFVRFAEPYVEGLHRHDERTQVYVSRGTGFWGPPLRLAAPAEITKFILN